MKAIACIKARITGIGGDMRATASRIGGDMRATVTLDCSQTLPAFLTLGGELLMCGDKFLFVEQETEAES